MSDPPASRTRRARAAVSTYVQNTILAGLLAAIPLVVTWVVVSFLIRMTAYLGRPAIELIATEFVQPLSPAAADWLLKPFAEGAFAVLFVVLALFVLGVLTRQVARGRLVQLFHVAVERIPFASKIYGATRKLVEALQKSPNGMQRVVLIEFPSPDVKAVGLVTRTMTDPSTGEELAAVFVPNTPNPTNGFLEIVPVSKLIATELTMDEAMNFIISGGAVGPERIAYRTSAAPAAAKS
jgi:uncharacterized membrane protein